jgi:hypothetical protein
MNDFSCHCSGLQRGIALVASFILTGILLAGNLMLAQSHPDHSAVSRPSGPATAANRSHSPRDLAHAMALRLETHGPMHSTQHTNASCGTEASQCIVAA